MCARKSVESLPIIATCRSQFHLANGQPSFPWQWQKSQGSGAEVRAWRAAPGAGVMQVLSACLQPALPLRCSTPKHSFLLMRGGEMQSELLGSWGQFALPQPALTLPSPPYHPPCRVCHAHLPFRSPCGFPAWFELLLEPLPELFSVCPSFLHPVGNFHAGASSGPALLPVPAAPCCLCGALPTGPC